MEGGERYNTGTATGYKRSTISNDELITLFETIRLGGVAYSRGCGVFDGITILVEERGALPTSGLDARKAVHVTGVGRP